MRRGMGGVTRAAAVLGLVLLVGVAPVFAQSPTTVGPAHPIAAAPSAAPGPRAEPREGTAMPMMDMCRHMMGAQTPGMGAGGMDPTMMAHMLEMRGEMMKAMGEIMLKHGKMMREAEAPK